MLRSRDDGDRLRDALTPGGHRLVIVGSGLIGMEVAASARRLGDEVTVLSLDAAPLPLLGDRLGRELPEVFRRHGVDLRLGTGIAAIEGGAGRVTAVRPADGDPISADLVLVAAGAVPEVALAADAGLAVDDGVVLDPEFRTADPAILAIGDIANVVHAPTGRRIRSEHWSHARTTGGLAAEAILGRPARYEAVPYFQTEHFGRTLGCSGLLGDPAGTAPVVRDGDDGTAAVAVWLDADGRVVAGVTIGRGGDDAAIQDAIRSGHRVDPARIADAGVPLTVALGGEPA